MKKSQNNRRWLFLGIFLPLIIFAIIASISIKKSKLGAEQAFNSPEAAKVRQILTNWNSGDFHPITTREEIKAELSERLTPISDFSALENTQRLALLDSLGSFFLAYHSSDLTDFFAFRIPASAQSGQSYVANLGEINKYKRFLPSSDVIDKELKKAGNANSAAELGYDLSKPLFVIETYRGFIDTASRKKQGSTTPCVTCLTAVNFDTLHFRSEVVTSVEALSLQQVVSGMDSIGMVQPLPDISFQPSARDVIRDTGSVRYASMVVTVQAERFGIKAFPVAVLWYWAPSLGTWLPEEMLLLSRLNAADIMF